MALIPCKECGRRVSDQASSCPGCGAPIEGAGRSQKVDTSEPKRGRAGPVHADYAAGEEAGRGCVLFFTSRPVAYVVFVLAWLFGWTYLGDRFGYLESEVTPPLWFGFVALVLPFILVVVLRRPIGKIIPVIMGSGLMILLVFIVYLLLLMGVSMLHGLFFDWPGAQ